MVIEIYCLNDNSLIQISKGEYSMYHKYTAILVNFVGANNCYEY